MAWTDETKAAAIQEYLDSEPTPENSMEIVKEIAEKMGESPNGLRMILSKAGAYVKKDPAAKTTTASKTAAGGDKAPRVSKEAAHARLTTAIEAANRDADAEIIGKLTGKAALYFAEVLESVNGDTD